MARSKSENVRVSIYRVEDSSLSDEDLVREYESYVDAEKTSNDSCFTTKVNFGASGIAYVKQISSKIPQWQKTFFKNRVGVTSKTSGAALISRVFVDGLSETFVVTFGPQGRHIVKGDLLDDRFGLKTVLNMIDSRTLKQIGKNELTGSNRITQQQIAKGTTISDFEIDPFGDYVKSVVGNALPEFDIEGALKGSAALSINKEVDVDNITEFLEEIAEIYRSEKYKEKFEWIDHLCPVTNKKKKDALFKSAIDHLNKKDGSVWLAVPEFFDIAKVGCFSFGGIQMNDILFEEIIEEEGGALKVEDFDRDVRALDNENGNLIKAWKLRKCLCGEIELDGDMYGASDGVWFKIDRDYANKVNNEYLEIELYDGGFDDFDYSLDTKTQNNKGTSVRVVSESAYLERIAKSYPSRFALMDRKGVSGIEVCDLVTSDALIHAKRYRSSDTLSHAFFQGLNSATMLVNDARFLEGANEKIREQTSDTSFLIDNGDKKDVVFAIIAQGRDERPHLPLFSKISLIHAISRLKSMDYKGKVAAIHIKNQ